VLTAGLRRESDRFQMSTVRILVVGDSVVVRKLLCEALAASPEVQVAGTAASGTIALAKIPQLNPDVITLDVEMPGLNGIQTLTEIRRLYPKLPVIMVRTLTERGALVTLEALSRGASDYVAKPSTTASFASAMEQVRRELIGKILSLVRLDRPQSGLAASPKKSNAHERIDIAAIGTSTGGPNALAEVVSHLPGDLPVPVVVVQHMPPLFTRMLAERLNSESLLRARDAAAGHDLNAGEAWIAKGDHHLTVFRKGANVILRLNQEAPQNSSRPAVDVLFRSLAHVYGPHGLAVAMTGMGSDGARGATCMWNSGGEVFVQDEASSVVWGMPGAVVNAGAADKHMPLSEISTEIVRRITVGRKRTDRSLVEPAISAEAHREQKGHPVSQ
jgi:two-component system chemotaxis response regulator CheB